MEIRFTKLSDERHAVTVVRRDGSTETVELETRSFLRHDLAHLVAEGELGLAGGVWGSVAAGGSLSGEGLDGADMLAAESVAGPLQTLFRLDAEPAAIEEVLARTIGDVDTAVVAARIHERFRQLRGHWAATPYGDDMVLEWGEPPAAGDGPAGRPR